VKMMNIASFHHLVDRMYWCRMEYDSNDNHTSKNMTAENHHLSTVSIKYITTKSSTTKEMH
jgi:hypothetical protein